MIPIEMSRSILILGKGFVGQHFAQALPSAEWSSARIQSLEDAYDLLRGTRAHYIINCVGRCGYPTVDWCEKHPEETFASNVLVPGYLAIACSRYEKKLVHISSGCLFDGSQRASGFSEEDAPNFSGSLYSRSKQLAEEIVQEFASLQLRLRMPLGSKPHPRNLLTKLLKYSGVLDHPNSISVMDDFIRASVQLIEQDAEGIFNVVNPGAITHRDILEFYQKHSGRSLDVKYVGIQDFSPYTLAPRSNCLLSTEKLRSAGVVMPHALESMERSVREYWRNENTAEASMAL